MKSNTTRNIINYTYIKDKRINITLRNNRDDGAIGSSFLDYKNKKFGSKKVSTHIPQFLPVKKTRQALILSQTLEKMKENLQNIKKYNKDRVDTKLTIIDTNALKKASSLKEIYGSLNFIMKKSSTRIDKPEKHIDDEEMRNIKLKIDMNNRNLEKNRLKEHLKKLVLDGVNIKTKVNNKKTEDDEFKTNLIMIKECKSPIKVTLDTREGETLANHPTTAQETKDYFSDDEIHIPKFSLTTKEKIENFHSTGYKSLNFDSSKTLINHSNEHLNSLKKQSSNVGSENNLFINTMKSLKNTMKYIPKKKKNLFSNIITDKKRKTTPVKFRSTSEKKSNAINSIQKETSKEDFNKEYAREYKRIVDKIERDKKKYIRDGILNTSDIERIMREKKEIELENLKKKYLTNKPILTLKLKVKANQEEEKLKRMSRALESLNFAKLFSQKD